MIKIVRFALHTQDGSNLVTGWTAAGYAVDAVVRNQTLTESRAFTTHCIWVHGVGRLSRAE